MKITLISYSASKYIIENVENFSTIYELKNEIENITKVPVSEQRLCPIDSNTGDIGELFEDNKALSYYNIKDDDTLILHILEYYKSDLTHRGPIILDTKNKSKDVVYEKYGWPYSPSRLNNIYKSSMVAPLPNKKQVVITIIMAVLIPASYLQSCMDVFCDKYKLPRTELEVIPLGDNVNQDINFIQALLINNLIKYVDNLNNNNLDYFNRSDFIDNYFPILTSGTPIEISISKNFRQQAENMIPNLFETLLDSQWSYAMNTNAHIRIVQGVTMSYNNLYGAVAYASDPDNFKNNKWGPTDIISMSWGANDNYYSLDVINNAEQAFFNNKICYLAASQDNYIVGYPSTSQNVLGVGGTALYNTASNEITQTYWNDNNGNGGGCGPSRSVPKPYYQNNINELSSFTTKCSPDISCLSDSNTGVFIMFSGTKVPDNFAIMIIGGTSLATPMTAGMLSKLIQTSINNNGPSFTTILDKEDSILLQDVLYNIYKNPKLYSECFYDVTIGGVNQYNAKVGFDIPTGLGTPFWDNITELLFPTLSSDTCFPNNTPIVTDQGIVNIEDIDIEKHTIKNNKIVAITKSIHNDDYLVCFSKNSLGNDMPSQDTITSSRHKVFYNNKMIEARKITEINKNVTKIKYDKSILYNILLDKHSVVYVNNMICETLHPDNIIAKLYTRFSSKQARDEIIYKLNKYIKNKDYNSYKNIINKIENTRM